MNLPSCYYPRYRIIFPLTKPLGLFIIQARNQVPRKSPVEVGLMNKNVLKMSLVINNKHILQAYGLQTGLQVHYKTKI